MPRAAVSFALAQIGKPYVWRATGPGSYDCSGLVMTAWANAAVQISRTTCSQWAAPARLERDLQPGDLVFFDAEGHVAMYVGNGVIVDAPQPGQNVEEPPMSGSWYAYYFDGATRPSPAEGRCGGRQLRHHGCWAARSSWPGPAGLTQTRPVVSTDLIGLQHGGHRGRLDRGAPWGSPRSVPRRACCYWT